MLSSVSNEVKYAGLVLTLMIFLNHLLVNSIARDLIINNCLYLPVELAGQQVDQLLHLPTQEGQPVLIPTYELHYLILLG